MALPQVLHSHGLANQDPRSLHNVPMLDKKCMWYFYEEKKRMALSTRLRAAGNTRSKNSLVRSKTQGKVPRLEIKNKT